MKNRKKLYKNFNTHLISHFSILIIFFLLVLGCGKKAPPVPPHQAKPQTINDLRSTINGGTLKLTWAILTEKGGIISGLSRFIVYRSKMLHSDSKRKNSPVLFKRVADILIEVSTSGFKKGVIACPESLEKVYRYIYKIIVYGKEITCSY
ncbi:MAG: hypothetical protein JRI30_07280 [Deltaproteobacteria bacterium]|nr:hypothetical protein [Deltaproteobacteria bacterium]